MFAQCSKVQKILKAQSILIIDWREAVLFLFSFFFCILKGKAITSMSLQERSKYFWHTQ